MDMCCYQHFGKISFINKNDYFSLTDIARYKNPEAPADVVKNWLRRKDTIEFIGLWEKLNNPNFNVVEFDQFKNEAGHNYFTLSPKKWIDGVNDIGIISKAGKYNAGTYAHIDIALQFASWVSLIYHQRIPEAQSGRVKATWLDGKTRTRKDKLPYSYRCHQG